MTRAYKWLGLATTAGTVALVLFARVPKPTPSPEVTTSGIPTVSLALEIVNGGIRPERTTVPKGVSLTISVRNRDAVPRRLSLAGYEDRWNADPIAARGDTAIRFRADRPGSDFTWLVDGRPSGTFAVAGPHLEEGHQ